MLISAEALKSHLGDATLRIVDCRFELMRPAAGCSSHRQGHIPGAVFADLDKDLSAPIGPDTGRHPLPSVGDLAMTFGRLGIGSDTQVVVYDDCSGALASRAWWLLRWLGHERVALLEGGMARWQSLRLPIEVGDVTVQERVFDASPRPELILKTHEIVAAGQSVARLQLVDARDAARFRGDHEPLDVVAGHIPGAINLPFSESINADGMWKGTDELKRLWTRVLGAGHEGAWRVMCGSGVTACHLAMSGMIAGLDEPQLYVGSWSEWIRDPARPIATGAS